MIIIDEVTPAYLGTKSDTQLAERYLLRVVNHKIYEAVDSLNNESNLSGLSLKLGIIVAELQNLYKEKWVEETEK